MKPKNIKYQKIRGNYYKMKIKILNQQYKKKKANPMKFYF